VLLGLDSPDVVEHNGRRWVGPTRRLAQRLFDEVLATGGDTTVFVARADGRVEDGGMPTDEEEPPDASDALYEGAPVDAIRANVGRVQVRCAANQVAEIGAIVDDVRAVLAEGTSAADCVVAFADGDAYASWVERAFRGAGIPVALALRQSLLPVPVAHRFLAVAREFAAHEPRPPAEWKATLLAALNAEGLPESLAAGRDADAIHSRRAWACLLEVLERVVLELGLARPGPFRAGDFAEALDEAVARAALPRPPTVHDGVRVLDVRDLVGLTPKRLWIGGLGKGAFPRALAQPWLAPAPVLEGMWAPDRRGEAASLFLSILRNTLSGDGIEAVTLSWPATLGEAPNRPSPILAAYLGGVELSPVPAPPRARVVAPCDRALVERRAAMLASRLESTFGPYDGLALARDVPSIPVTQLETFAQCPLRYAFRHVLALEPLAPEEPELAADARGTAVHRILERFYTERAYAPLQGIDDAEVVAAAAELCRIGTEVFEQIATERAIPAAIIAVERERWLSGLLDAAEHDAPGVLRVWLDAEVASPFRMRPLALEEPIVGLRYGGANLSGRIDRLDEVPGGILVTDTKTGRVPGKSDLERGLFLQPLVYALAVRRRRPDAAVAFSFQRLAVRHGVSRAGWFGDPDLLERLGASRPARVAVQAAGFARFEGHLHRTVERLLSGRFHPTLADPESVGCTVCSFRHVCHRDTTRAVRVLRENPAPWQAPLAASDP
jgi:RecB family exonuclease